MSKLNNQILQLDSFISKADIICLEVSKRGVDWHIEHTLKVLNGVSIAMQSEKALKLKGSISFTGRLLMTVGSIPKGKGKAPKAVNNLEEVDRSSLQPLIEEVRVNLNLLGKVPSSASFQHPIFNVLNKKRTLRFLELHTQHHIKIIQDILKNNA